MKTIYRRLLSRFQLKLKQVKSYLSQDVGQMDAFYIELIYFIFDSENYRVCCSTIILIAFTIHTGFLLLPCKDDDFFFQ